MKKEKRVLLVVDPINGFKNKETEKALKKTQNIMDYFDTIFVTEFFNPKNSLYNKLLHWHHFSKHKDKKYFNLAVKVPAKAKIIETHTYGKITKKIARYLKSHKVKTVYICGLQTDVSVYKTALDLFDMGIVPVIIKDACGSCRGKTNHDMGIKMATRQIGEDQILTFKELKDKLEPKVIEMY